MTTKLDKGWYGLDLDGTVARCYWHDVGASNYDPLIIGEPLLPMIKQVKKWLAEGIDVRIFTARVADYSPADTAIIVKVIEKWCLKNIGQILPVTNIKDQNMLLLFDDRARRVEYNTGRIIDEYE
jgi:hypothetical protein